MTLYVRTQGQGPALVLLHGLFGSADNWGNVAKRLASDYQVITLDLRNHGRSPHAATHCYAEMADDVRETCDRLGLEKLHLLGHSMGGKVAMHFAARFSARLHSLCVVDMPMRSTVDQHTVLIDAMLAVDLTRADTRRAVDLQLSAAIPDIMVRQFLLTNLVNNAGHMQWRLNLAALKANYAHIQEAVNLTVPCDIPALFMYGSHSDYVQSADRTEIATHFLQVRFASLPCSHWVHAEQPELFCQTLQVFLSGISH